MATTTPNYGWAVPTSTDLVKDGATAIETLGDAIDASMFTALGTKKAGMVLLNTTSFSGVASTSFPADTFTTTYNNYFIVVDAATAGAGYLQFRLRAAGTDATGNNYNFSYVRVIATTASGNTTTQTQFPFPHSGSITNNYGTLYVYNPKLAVPTGFMANSLANADGVAITGGMHTLSTSYDSITLFTSTGNMTGSISIYGVNK